MFWFCRILIILIQQVSRNNQMLQARYNRTSVVLSAVILSCERTTVSKTSNRSVVAHLV